MDVGTDIIATDFHPSVLANHQSNIVTNFLHPSSVLISSHFLDWSTFPTLHVLPAPFDRTFDVIIGADIIYEASHALWIKSCLQRILRKPGVLPALLRPTFHLVIPLRPTHATESQTIEEVFPQVYTRIVVPYPSSEDMELVILEKEIIVCEAGEGRREKEVEDGYYKIGCGFM